MRVEVVISFHDAANFAIIHKVGDVIDVSEERAQKLTELGLVKKVEEAEEHEAEEHEAEEHEAPVERPTEVSEEEKPKRRRNRR